ncbi:MAG: ABC transporter permease [Deltaproteobacteria bacterium]|nr:MAG: ABC transporter permease [Deltaproteobacteria bacterium]
MHFLRNLGARALGALHDIGQLTVLLFRILVSIPRLDVQELWRNFYKVGVKSFPIVFVTAILTGAIMVIQSGQLVAQYDAFGLLGWGAGYATLREIGPILIGLMFSGRVGANNTAELGTMKITEQVDALRALAINPIPYLLAPRFIAIISMMFLLTLIGNMMAILGGALTAQLLLEVDYRLFFWSISEYLVLGDLWNGLVKAFFFGVAIAIVSCHYGYATSGGAVGVGRAVNSSVVVSAISIFVLNFSIGALTL